MLKVIRFHLFMKMLFLSAFHELLQEVIPILAKGSLILPMIFLYGSAGLGYGWLVLLFPALYIGSTLLLFALLIIGKWILFPFGMKPSLHPVYGWVHCRWIAARVLQKAIFTEQISYISKTPLLSWIYRALGARIGSNVIIDTLEIYEPSLVEIGNDSKIDSKVQISPVMIVPKGVFHSHPVLVFSKVVVGDGCQVGHGAVMPAGSRLKSHHHLRPQSAPSHPRSIGPGSSKDYEYFVPEEHLSMIANAMCSLAAVVLRSVAELAGYSAAFALVGVSLHQNPLAMYTQMFFDTNGDAAYRVEWVVLFSIYYTYIGMMATSCVSVLLLVLMKLVFVGKLLPGLKMADAPGVLWRFSLWQRLVTSNSLAYFAAVFGATKIQVQLSRLLGASIGKGTYISALHMTVPDAIEIADNVSSGSNTVAKCIDADGVVRRTVLDLGCTVGNNAVLYPGACVGKLSILGNDSVLKSGETLPPLSTRQGRSTYKSAAARAFDNMSSDDMEGIESGAQWEAAKEPKFQSLKISLAMYVLAPTTYAMRWLFPVLITSYLATYFLLIPIIVFLASESVGIICAALWVRLLSYVSGMRSKWKAGESNVFYLATAIGHCEFLVLKY